MQDNFLKTTEGNSTNSGEQNTNGFKALYVGQIAVNKQRKFQEVMESLSDAYIQGRSQNDGETCIIYDYYDKEKAVEDIRTNTNEHILNNVWPAKWAEKWATVGNNRTNCIEIIDHMLELSGFGQYLSNEKNKIELTKTHDICCCITYYHNRAGDVGFHQDSLGAELFVSLIYRNSVYGPELKLKEEKLFKERLDDIKGIMPECFITKLGELYNNVEDESNDLVQIKGKSLALHPDLIEWPGRLEQTGGIVAWVDELMIHTSPYMYHRHSNGVLLLSILEEMREVTGFKWEAEAEEIKHIKLLKTIIDKILEEETPHYITIYELKDKIKNEEETNNVLEKLYTEVGKRELEGREQYEEYRQLLRDYVKLYVPSFNINRSLDDLLNDSDEFEVESSLKQQGGKLAKLKEAATKLRELKKNGVEVVLGSSNHELYGKEEVDVKPTGSSKRRLSMEVDQEDALLIRTEEGLQRSFLRVWVIALPKY